MQATAGAAVEGKNHAERPCNGMAPNIFVNATLPSIDNYAGMYA
jgi:hypothetical protein